MPVNPHDPPVLTVRDIEATCAFYGRALGMATVATAEGRKALRFGDRTIDLLQAGHEPDPEAPKALPGTADLRFLTPTPLAQVIDHLNRVGVPIEEGPLDRTGPEGPTRSLTLRDPDGNRIEVANAAP